MTSRYIVCLDFDGVLHSYTSGWQGVSTISDPPVPGAIEYLEKLIVDPEIRICIYSSRSKEPEGIIAMKEWLKAHITAAIIEGNTNIPDSMAEEVAKKLIKMNLEFPETKPSAFITIDDRALTFNGDFNSAQYSPEKLKSFKPWNKKG